METILYKDMRKKKPKKRRGLIKRLERELTVKGLRSKLDEVFSFYIKQRDGRCVEKEMWGGCNGPIQAGHVISRRHLATRWDERNVYGECRSHNYQHTFNPNLYISWLTKTHGSELYEELVRLSRTTFKPTKQWLLDRIKYYEQRT